MKNKISVFNRINLASYWFSLAISTIFCVLCAVYLPIRFEVIDDWVMLLFASGEYTGTPEPYLVFINYLYGAFLSKLYLLTDKIEWYSLSFVLIHIFSLAVLIWKVLKKDLNRWTKIAIFFLVLSIEAKLIINFQFTTTAAIAALAGFSLLSEPNRRCQAFAVLLMLISSLIRFEAFCLVLLVVSPLLIYYFFETKVKRSKFWLVCYLLTICLAVLFKGVDTWIYKSNDDWSKYKQRNELRGKINDNPNARKIFKILPGDISINDYELLLDAFGDKRILSLQKLKELNNIIGELSVKQKINNIFPAIRSYWIIILLLLLLSYVVWKKCILHNKSRLGTVVILLSVFVFLGGLCYVSLNGTLKYRVFISAFSAFLFVIFSFVKKEEKDIWHKMFFTIVLILTVGFFFETIQKSYEVRLNAKKEYVEQNELLKQFFAKENRMLLFADYSGNYIPPFSSCNNIPTNSLLFSGWIATIPFDNNRLTSHFSLVQKDIAIFVAQNNYIRLSDKFQKSIKDNYGADVEKNILLQSNNYVIFKLEQIQ